MNSYRTIDLFCGGGGLSQGLTDAGFKVVAAFDNWEPAIRFYNHNLTTHRAYRQDLSNVENAVEILRPWEPEVIAGGPPCQDFSSAGKRDENGGRADLTIAFARIVTALKPRIFIMENVERARRTRTYQAALEELSAAGYNISLNILDASLCGVPQKRKRAIAVGILGATIEGLVEICKALQSDRPMTMRDFFGDRLGIDYYYRHPRSYARRAVFSLDEPSPTIRGVNRPIPKGYPGHKGDPVPITHERLRPLTTKERSLVQTFPEKWSLIGGKSDLEQIIGNAVPVKLAQFIGNAVKKFCEMRANANRTILEKASGQVIFVFEQKSKYATGSVGKHFPDTTDLVAPTA